MPPIDRFCPKCASNRIYTDDGMFACRECGNRWLPDYKPYKKVTEEEPMPKKFMINDDTLREKVDLGETFPEIMKELGCSRATLDRNLKRLNLKAVDGRSQRYNKPGVKKLSPEKFKKIVTPAPEQFKKKVMPFFPNKDTDKITSLDMLIAERNGYQDKVFKLNQAIEILRA